VQYNDVLPGVNFCSERPFLNTVLSKLREKYGDDVYISRIPSKETVVCFRNSGNRILTQHWYRSRLENTEEERLRIVKTAAEIILEDIRSAVHDLDTYRPCAQFFDGADDQLPKSLKVLLEGGFFVLLSPSLFFLMRLNI